MSTCSARGRSGVLLCTDVHLTLSMSQYAHSELPGQRRCFTSILDRSSDRTLIEAADVLVWNTASDLGPVAFAFPLLDDRWCNCGVKQPASDWPPSDSLCTQTQPTPSDRVAHRPTGRPPRVFPAHPPRLASSFCGPRKDILGWKGIRCPATRRRSGKRGPFFESNSGLQLAETGARALVQAPRRTSSARFCARGRDRHRPRPVRGLPDCASGATTNRLVAGRTPRPGVKGVPEPMSGVGSVELLGVAKQRRDEF